VHGGAAGRKNGGAVVDGGGLTKVRNVVTSHEGAGGTGV
jgi:hypothetical protein